MRFVLIPPGEKGPRSLGWNKLENGMLWNDIRLHQHIRAGGNYGYYPAPKSCIISLDVDNAGIFHQAGGYELIGDTFRYTAWQDCHKYRAIVECPDIPPEWKGHKTSITQEDRSTIFEIFFPANKEKTGGQCVGPGSTHPNGNRYLPFDHKAPFWVLSWVDIWEIVEKLSPATIKPTIPESINKLQGHGHSVSLTDRYGLSVRDHYPDNPHIAGDEVRGAHPVHGSTTGENVSVNPAKGTFYCFRCGRGGDAAIWDAINRGIIRCDEPYDVEALKRHVEILDYERPEVRYLERIEWKRKQQKMVKV
ncbi:hypothetical protein [uncultured Methanospirillum sp.]|uniref:hypothetical protein n=1 Tax=uncultured Methanospirillum sp. TaxID=262503 RepID=UPI0029C7D8F8|nr:hypothetical protein [uncultured Methanospirillum sp.]